MTEPQDSTRPISVAELLARNGTIGAPPVGGRRRRRRGNTDSVTVAELTGEIPIVTVPDETEAPVAVEPPPPIEVIEVAEPPAAGDAEGAEPEPDSAAVDLDDPAVEVDEDAEPAEEPVESVDEPAEPVEAKVEADYAAHLEQRDADPEPLEFTPPPRRPQVGTPTGFASSGGAEQMSPDPAVDDDVADDDIELDFVEIASGTAELKDPQSAEAMPSYLRSTSDTLFGGQSVADDLARRGLQPGPEDIDLGDDADDTPIAAPAEGTATGGSAFLRGAWVVVQCILAVAFGAGLFIAFDQLWKWNTIVALVLSGLVLLGLVAAVRVVRKTEDTPSTLIAVAVGALVTFGPLALMQSR